MIILYEIGDKFGKAEANKLKTRFACIDSEMPPVNEVDEDVPILNLTKKVLVAKSGSQFYNLGVPEANLTPYTGQVIIDQNNDPEIMVEVPPVVQSATMKLLGLSFPGYFYTEYPAINAPFWSTNVCDGHDHTGSVSGTTNSDSHTHNHIYTPGDTGGIPTSDDSHSHDHSFSDSFTTASNTAVHKHQITVNFSGSSQKTTFNPSLLQIYITADRASWGAARSIDVSQLYAANGTAHLDISAFLTANCTNYIKFHLNTATALGGKISYLISIK